MAISFQPKKLLSTNITRNTFLCKKDRNGIAVNGQHLAKYKAETFFTVKLVGYSFSDSD